MADDATTEQDASILPAVPPMGEAFLRVAATCPDAIIFICSEGRIVFANPAASRMFEYSLDELIGADVRILMAEPYASHHKAYVARYESTGKKQAIGRIRLVSARRSSGAEFPIELSITPLGDESFGAKYGAFIRDVSEKVRLQAELMDRERVATVGTTASMLAHEIGNPLNNMALQLQALRRRLGRIGADADEAVNKVDSCLAEVERLSRLVNEFRALSGRRRLDRKRVNLTRIIESVLAGMSRGRQNIEVVREFGDEGALVFADADKMQQVFLNLCHNAAEAMPNGGQLTVRTGAHTGEYYVEVTDTGPGIPEGMDVFEPFVTTKADGTGLGLAICSEIVREHEGSLTYESSSAGTTFRLRLPLGAHQDAPVSE